MDNLKIKITFTQPVRVVPWQKKEIRKFDKAYKRGGTFANWHMEKELEYLGRPYITGSVLRSVLFAELEKVLAIHNPYNCCSMPDKTEDGISRPDFIRKRAVYNYNSESDYCTYDNPCPLCLLKGRYDKLRRKKKAENKQDHLKNFTVHFANIRSKADNLIWGKTAVSRIVNRVDPESGKAKDYFTIYEIEPSISGNYCGTITINNNNPEQKNKVKKLIAAGLAQIKVLAGSICRIDIISEEHDDLIKDYMGVEDVSAGQPQGDQDVHIEKSIVTENISSAAEEISAIFKSGGKEQKLRFTADVIRELRHEDFSIVNDLPKGKDNSEHFLWDQKSTPGNKTLREILKTSAANVLSDKWRFFCETLGQKLYELSKKAGTRAVALPRLLGETEYFGDSAKYKDSYIPAKSAPSVKWTIAGVLKAETPFFFGSKTTSSQTSNAILLNRDNSFRLPASVIRGSLRRDLRAVIGDGCNMPVGGKPCDCPVCIIMKGLIVEDSRSSCTMPPEIRYRIRLNPHTGTVDEGALFDMETGFQGIVFPFRLYIETPSLIIDKKLKEVLSLWQSGHAFLGGNFGAGLGRFILDDAKQTAWDINDDDKEDYTACLLCRGYAGTKMPDLNGWDSFKRKDKPDDNFFQWEKIAIKININSPLLSRDVIRAMLDKRNPDAVMFRKAIFVQNKENSRSSEFEYRYAIKGESFRGIIRNAVAKGEYGQKEKVYDIDHEECDCIQCRLFGSVHKQGSVRFEDLEVTNFTANNNNDMKMDHVAIDRFTGGGVDQMKFDDYPLPGSRNKTLTLKGTVWIKKGIDEKGKEALCSSFADLRDGFLTLGGLGAIGYGNVNSVEFIEKPDWFKLSDRNTAIIDFSDRRALFLFSEPKIENNVIYHPHTFLKPPERNVVREKDPVSHIKNKDTEGNPLWSGKITCSLTTRGPVFIPDTNNDDYFNMKGKYPDHKNYGFFRINNELAIPGSSIRGMVSSVYESLTNSCFRVMDQKKRLSWRMEAKNLNNDWNPGRVIEKEGVLYIEEMKEMRLPVYDNPELKNKIKKEGGKGYYKDKKIPNKNGKIINKKGQPADVETLLLDNAEEVRNFLKENAELLSGKASGKWFRGIPHGMDSIALLSKPAKGIKKNSEWVTEGYIHFTGPNKIEVEKKSTGKIGCSQDKIALNIKHNTVKLDKVTVTSKKPGEKPKQVERERAISKYVINSNGCVYTMTKRCERVFFKIKNGEKYVLGNDAKEKFHQLCLEYRANRKTIPEVFQTILPESNNLTSGDLIYFRQLNGKVADVIPVRISRIVDSEPISKKFPNNNDSLRPCHHKCIENCDECPELCNKVSDYFSPHPLGLCPACHLFGTAHYKGRVGFGIAWLESANPVWYKTDNDNPARGGSLTLPLLERPRPTWSMPDKDAKIPGRKFYIHHPWSVDKIKETVINENNRTIQPVGKDNVFEFDVRFDNLRKWELGLLIYALELENNLAHKLGMGKALGLGSVQIKAKNVLLKDDLGNTASDKHNKKEIINEGLDHLRNNLLSGDYADVSQNEYIKQLRLLLWLPEKNNDIQVCYPILKKENDVLGKKENDVSTYIDLQKDLQQNDRLKHLCTPWMEWHNYSKTPDVGIEKSVPKKSDIKTQPAVLDKPKHTGIVKWFNDKKRYGFIAGDDGRDLFVHHSDIVSKDFKLLQKGQRVKFNKENAQKGPTAIDVEIDK